jgi:D-alanyl-lipoteichoic acid acyltransferase DltB (MBOAT superfamily)
MLFNSYEFVFVFLPLAFALFWYGGRSLRWRLTLLTTASYAFYSWWQFASWEDFAGTFCILSADDLLASLWRWRFTLIMLASSSIDYWAAKAIVGSPPEKRWRRGLLLALSLAANLGLLAFFKYSGFFTQIASDLSSFLGGGSLPVVALLLPVGISFYTFESMSYVIDIYRGVARPAKSYLDYACFIAFFPHLVAGPIIRYSDILHQFRDATWKRPGPDWEQVNIGLLLFTFGMAKKLLIADVIAMNINPLWGDFAAGGNLGLVGSWAAVLGYTFRIYFDFSGYSDMAVGLGHLFGVRLPQNFNSPYKATDPSDFWRRSGRVLGRLPPDAGQHAADDECPVRDRAKESGGPVAGRYGVAIEKWLAAIT